MLTVTYEEFIKIHPCWLDNEEQAERLKGYFKANPNMSALDMLGLDDVSIDDKFWAVLREKLIPANTLHEFACLCAERALSKVDNPDPRSVAAITAKRKWMRGEITNKELKKAWDAARMAVRKTDWTASYAAWAASWAAGAAEKTEQKWQLDTLIKLLEEKEG